MRWFAIKDYPLNNDADYINLALHNENAKYCYGDDGYHSTFFLVLLFVMLLSNEIWVFVMFPMLDAFPHFPLLFQTVHCNSLARCQYYHRCRSILCNVEIEWSGEGFESACIHRKYH